jgi:hypothetical protein
MSNQVCELTQNTKFSMADLVLSLWASEPNHSSTPLLLFTQNWTNFLLKYADLCKINTLQAFLT